MVRTSNLPAAGVELSDDLPAGAAPYPAATSSGDGRDRLLDVLRARGLRFRDGARWQPAR
ncbi:hypothetical protein ACIBCR_30645 [Micromonospora echinospora]|uniref:hypothetical protein n=1 Tax=Micromonospora echinospora TaxID=1877 RepID=UPI0037BDFDC1